MADKRKTSSSPSPPYPKVAPQKKLNSPTPTSRLPRSTQDKRLTNPNPRLTRTVQPEKLNSQNQSTPIRGGTVQKKSTSANLSPKVVKLEKPSASNQVSKLPVGTAQTRPTPVRQDPKIPKVGQEHPSPGNLAATQNNIPSTNKDPKLQDSPNQNKPTPVNLDSKLVELEEPVQNEPTTAKKLDTKAKDKSHPEPTLPIGPEQRTLNPAARGSVDLVLVDVLRNKPAQDPSLRISSGDSPPHSPRVSVEHDLELGKPKTNTGSHATIWEGPFSDQEFFNTNEAPVKKPTVTLYEAYKNYGSANRYVQVLSGCNLKAFGGEIYVLLSPQSSGKTTVIKVLLGYTVLNQGLVWVFGQNPSKKHNHISRNDLGFGSQTPSLYTSLKINEMFIYYQKVLQLDPRYVRTRIDFLSDLLLLPSRGKSIGRCGSSMQRRIRLALALLHEPKLIILDEPTFAMNPYVKRNLWKYLRTLVEEGKRTIIIASQSISEAESANRIGILYQGKIVAEGNPSLLTSQFKETDLRTLYCNIYNPFQPKIGTIIDRVEETYYEQTYRRQPLVRFDLSLKSGKDSHMSSKSSFTSVSKTKQSQYFGDFWQTTKLKLPRIRMVYISFQTTFTFCVHKFLWIILWLITPLPLLAAAFFATGGLDKDNLGRQLTIGVYSMEFYNNTMDGNCTDPTVSCGFINYFLRNGADVLMYNTMDEMLQDAKVGLVDGTVIFPNKITRDITHVIASISEIEDLKNFKGLNFIEIKHISINKFKEYALDQLILHAFHHLMDRINADDRVTQNLARYPLVIEPSSVRHIEHYATPTLLLSACSFIAAGASTVYYMKQRENQMALIHHALDIRSIENLLGVFFVFLILTILQDILFISLFQLIGMMAAKSLTSFLVILSVDMLKSIAVGRIIGIWCKTWFAAIAASIYIAILDITLSGTIYPYSGLPAYIQYISNIFTSVELATSLRNVAARGVSLTHSNVYPGICRTLFNCFIYYCIIVLLEHNLQV